MWRVRTSPCNAFEETRLNSQRTRVPRATARPRTQSSGAGAGSGSQGGDAVARGRPSSRHAEARSWLCDGEDRPPGDRGRGGGQAGSRRRCLSPAFAVPAHAPRGAGEQARAAQSQSGAGGRHPMDGSPRWGVSPRAWGRCPPQEPPAQARQGGHSHVASRDLPTPSLSTTKGKVTSQGRGCRHHPNQVIKETSPVT